MTNDFDIPDQSILAREMGAQRREGVRTLRGDPEDVEPRTARSAASSEKRGGMDPYRIGCFHLRAHRVGECLLWTGAKDTSGYGKLTVNSRRRAAHRVAYELARGPVPKGKVVRRICGNKLCVEPAHLVAVGRIETMRCLSDGTGEIR